MAAEGGFRCCDGWGVGRGALKGGDVAVFGGATDVCVGWVTRVYGSYFSVHFMGRKRIVRNDLFLGFVFL